MSAPNIFMAHPKDCPDLEGIYARLNEALQRLSPTPFQLVKGSDDWNRNFARFGSWDSWIYSVAHGTEYVNGMLTPRFIAYVITPELYVGKATAQIVIEAFRAQKPVYFFDGTKLAAARGITRLPDGTFQRGWALH